MIVSLCLISIIILFIYIHLRLRHRYWQNENIPHLQPTFFFGNAQDLCLGKKSMLEYQCDIYNKLKEKKLLGIYMFYKPTLYIGDVNWIDSILHRDFRYFFDRGLNFDLENEPLTKHLFHLEGQQWKSMRNKVMPAFTPDGIKIFFPMLVQSASKLRNYLNDILTSETDINLKDILSRYAADVIGICAYGLDSKALVQGNTEFYKMSKRIFSPRIRTLVKLILPRLPNFIVEYFDIKMVETQVSKYFMEILDQELRRRKQTKENAPDDFLEFMMRLQRNNNSDEMQLTDDLIMAQCFMFFIAGYENASGVLSATLFELADHPEIQNKLFEEIQSFCTNDSDELEITYEKISEMNYLDMVVSEIMRLYPPATALIRKCVQDYKIPGSDFTIRKGLQIVVPVCGIHRDPQYYPYANEFNPENFNEDAKKARSRCAYIPFGDGPRVCIGKRFGVSQIKVALIMLVHNYMFYPSAKMQRPVRFEKKVFVTSIEGGAWVRAKLRSNTIANIKN